jgi:dTDP-4-dehydrorhamnose reductase
LHILLTGVSGQVGGALRLPLTALGDVFAATRDALDLSQPGRLGAALDQMRPDLIINPAAYTAVDQAEHDQDLAFRINAEAPGAIARWAARNGAPLLHFSTDYVFDGSGEAPWRENSPPNPLSTYGASKLAGEQAIIDAGGSHLIVRTSWVYASCGKNFLTTMVRLAKERPELRVVADQIGAPTSARMIAEIVSRLLHQERSQPPHLEAIETVFARAQGLLHLCATGETSWHGFATAIVGGLRARHVPVAATRVTPIATADYLTPAVRPKNSRLALDRLRSVLGIEPSTWEQSLQCELDDLAQS